MNLLEDPRIRSILEREDPNITKLHHEEATLDLSIVIPVWIHSKTKMKGNCNPLQLTLDCIESIVNYTPNTYEIIVIDNGSEPTASMKLSQRLSLIPQVRYIRNEENLGCAKAWNQGILASHGRYICIANNDALISPEWIPITMAAFENNKHVAVISPAAIEAGQAKWPERHFVDPASIIVDNETMFNKWRVMWPHLSDTYSKKYQDYYDCAFRASWFTVRREVFEEIGCFHNKFIGGCYEDAEWMYRLMLRDWTFLCPHIIQFYHYQGVTTIAAFDKYSSPEVNGATFRSIWPQDICDEIYNTWMAKGLKETIKLPWSETGGYHA